MKNVLCLITCSLISLPFPRAAFGSATGGGNCDQQLRRAQTACRNIGRQRTRPMTSPTVGNNLAPRQAASGRNCQQAARQCAQACRQDRQKARQCGRQNQNGRRMSRQSGANRSTASAANRTAQDARDPRAPAAPRGGGGGEMGLLAMLALPLAAAMMMKKNADPEESKPDCRNMGAPDLGIPERPVCDLAQANALGELIAAERAKRARTPSPAPTRSVNPVASDFAAVKALLNTPSERSTSINERIDQAQKLIALGDVCGASASIQELEREGGTEQALELHRSLDRLLESSDQPPGEVGVALNCLR